MTSKTKKCPRCGIERVLGGNSSLICKDCRLVLSAAELQVWRAAA